MILCFYLIVIILVIKKSTNICKNYKKWKYKKKKTLILYIIKKIP